MNDSTEKLRHELQDARRTIDELQARLENREAGCRLTTLELEENRSALLFMLEDIEAGRKKIEQAHQEWVAALDVVDDPIFLHDKQFRILRCNKAYQRCAGMPFHELLGQPYYEVFPKTGAPLPCCLRVMEKTEAAADEEEMVFGDTTYRSRTFSVYGEQGGYLHSVHILEDITERKQAEERYRTLIDAISSAGIMLFLVDDTYRIRYMNRPMIEAFGDVVGKICYKGVAGIESPCSYCRLSTVIGGHSKMVHYQPTTDGGRTFDIIAIPYVDTDGKVCKLEVIQDITERKQAEAAIQHANRALATLGAVNHNLVHATDEDKLLQAICQAIVEQRGYRLAWVGYVQHDEHKPIKIMARAGHDEGYLDAMQLTWEETEYGMGPSGRAARSGTTQLCQDIANDLHYSPWRDAALKRGYAGSIALPLLNESNMVFGILHVYAEETNAFTSNEVDLLEEMAGDLAFGVRALHTRQERDLALVKNQEQLVQLQDNLEDTVRAIATIVEMRDPYTSGHQLRVADLAVAIAMQMGLPDEQVHGIHLAGTVHDLGKIQVPAEILSKPGRITDIEHSLIKIHPQAGYDILKGIDFPWPIAQMVLQHHERIDGSGYPQGLKGEAILLEARILSVADVVEAVSAHRPYRPGLGIEAALEEITKNCGIFYDPQVVNACLTLFREQGFSFK